MPPFRQLLARPGPASSSRAPSQGARSWRRSAPVHAVLTVLTVCALSWLAATPARAAPDRWVWPLAPRPEVVRVFEPPDSPWGAGHRGVDLLGTAGQPVRSAGAGVVTYAGLLAGRGVITVTHHGGLRTTYEPVAASVSVGARVRVGGRIGALTDTMSHCAPRACLHWGLLRGDTYLDPLTLLDTGPPRLLPLETPADESRGATGYPTQPAIGSAKAADLSSAGSPGGTNELTRADNAGANNAGAGNPGADNPGAQTTEVGATGADSTGARQMVSRLAPFTAPAAGGLAGAVVAGYLVSRTRAVPPSRSPPPAGPAGGSGSVVDLDTARRRLRDSA